MTATHQCAPCACRPEQVVKAEALREWIAGWPTTAGDGTFLSRVARDGLDRADRLERGEA